MQSLKTYFLVALLLGFLVGCSSDDDNIGDDAVSNDTDADTEMLNEAEDTNTDTEMTGTEMESESENVTPASLIGSWSSACTVDRDDDGDFDAIIYSFEFTESTFGYSLSSFVDEDCTSQAAGFEFSSIIRRNGSFSSVGQVTTSTGLIANELTLNIESGSSQFAGGEVVPTDLSELNQTTVPLLVFVDESDVLFIDDIFLGSPVNNTLNLDVPFQRQSDSDNLSTEPVNELIPPDADIVDLPDRYEITLRSTSESSQTADFTPSGTQQFSVDSGQSCTWTATDRNNDQLVAAGAVETDSNLLATVVGVPVLNGAGTRLTVDCAPLHPIAELLQGRWTTGCFLFEGEANSQSSRSDFTVMGNTSVAESRRFADFNCSVPAVFPDTGEEVMTRFEDTIIFPGETVATTLGEAPFINFFNGSSTRFSIFTVTPEDRLFFGDGISNTEENRPLTLDVFFFLQRR